MLEYEHCSKWVVSLLRSLQKRQQRYVDHCHPITEKRLQSSIAKQMNNNTLNEYTVSKFTKKNNCIPHCLWSITCEGTPGYTARQFFDILLLFNSDLKVNSCWLQCVLANNITYLRKMWLLINYLCASSLASRSSTEYASYIWVSWDSGLRLCSLASNCSISCQQR